MVGLAVTEATGTTSDKKKPKNDVSDRDVVVMGSGNLGLIYLMEERRRLTMEEIDERHPELLPTLRAHPHVGWLLVRSSEHGAVALGANGTHYLAQGRVEGEDPLAHFSPHAPQHLLRTDGFEHVGDIMVGSFYDPNLDEGCAFEELISFHGGIGGLQTRPFILHPTHLEVPGRPDPRRSERARHPRRLAAGAPGWECVDARVCRGDGRRHGLGRHAVCSDARDPRRNWEVLMAIARVVTFEGVSTQRIAELKREFEEGDRPDEVPAKEFLVLHDPESERSMAILLFDSEDDYRRGDEALNAMPTDDTPGQRTSVTKYDVAVRVSS